MKYSIIIPMYNAEKTISRCINSVLIQTYTNFECILVDDGSNDNTFKICNELIKNDNRFKLINQNNKGVSAARNKGIENASGDYLIFIDSDDYVENNLLFEIDNIANEDIIQYQFYSINKNKRKKVSNLKGSFDIIASNMAVVWRHAIPFNKVRNLRFDENLKGGEDYLYLNESLKRIGNVKISNKFLYNHVFDEKNSIMNNINLDLLNQQIIATEKARSLYSENEQKKYKKAFSIREKWCKGELLLYTFKLFESPKGLIKKIYYRILKKIIIILL